MSSLNVDTIKNRAGTAGPTFGGNSTVDGNLTIDGVLTYNDVNNVDSVGLITARQGIVSQGTINITGSNNGVVSAGVVTASSFAGDGSALTGLAADKIFEGNTKAEVVDTGSNGHFLVETEAVEALRVDASQRLLLGTTSELASSVANKLQIASSFGARVVMGRNDTSVSAGDLISAFEFYGNDSNGTYEHCARILVEADLDHDTGDKPSRLAVYTTPDASATPVERLRVIRTGAVSIGHAGDPVGQVEVSSNDGLTISNATRTGGSGAQWRFIPHNGSGSATNLRVYEGVGATEVINITKDGKIGIGVAAPNQELHIHANGTSYLQFTDETSGTGASDGVLIGLDHPNTYIWGYEAGSFIVATNGTEKFRISSSGEIGIGGANYGNAGQVLTSGGSGSAPSWADVSAGISTSLGLHSPGTVTIGLSTSQHHEIRCQSAGTYTINCDGGTMGDSHSVVIVQPSSGTATIGFSTYFHFPSGLTPTFSAGGSKVDLVSFVVKTQGEAGIATVNLASAGLDYQV